MAPASNMQVLKINDDKVSFVDLAPELRNSIYFMCLTSIRRIYINGVIWNPLTKRFIAIKAHPDEIDATVLRTCKAINAEATPILYGANYFDFSPCTGTLFLKTIGTSLQHLRSLRLSDERTQVDLKEALSMLMQCPNLEKVAINALCTQNFRKPETMAKALGKVVKRLHKEKKGKGAMEIVDVEQTFYRKAGEDERVRETKELLKRLLK